MPALPEPPASADAPALPVIRIELAPAAPRGYAALVALQGEHDIATCDELRAVLEPIAGDVLVDLSQCGFIDSSVLGVLLGRFNELRQVGSRLELVVPAGNQTVTRIVAIVGLRHLMTVHEHRPSGIEERS